MVIQLVFAKVFHVARWIVIGGWIGVERCTLCVCVSVGVCVRELFLFVKFVFKTLFSDILKSNFSRRCMYKKEIL